MFAGSSAAAASRSGCFGRFGFEGVLRNLDEFAESAGVGGGEVRQDFAVEGDFGGFEAFDETAVGQSGGPSGRVDADLPEITEGPFFYAAIAEGVLPAVVDGIRSITVQFG